MVLGDFRRFDVYSKPLEDFRVKTSFGGLVSLVSFAVIFLLFLSETLSYFAVKIAEELYVDSTSADLRVDIHFDITFPKLPCAFLTIDVMDVGGANQHDVKDDIFKLRIDKDGYNITGAAPIKQGINVNGTKETGVATKEPLCGSCYGAADGCCNTCEDVKQAYEVRGWTIEDITTIEQCKNDEFVQEMRKHKDEGCRIYGHVDVAKVEGNFHIAPGASVSAHRTHFHDLHSMSAGSFDTTHKINNLSFGKPYPGKHYPLNGLTFQSHKGGIMHQYFVKVVPTMFVYGVTNPGIEEYSYQFSVTRNVKDITAGQSGLPGLFVQYSFSPLMVKYEERKQALSQFLVSLCAIIGGVYTVASLVDSLIYSSTRVLRKMT
ncbi:unnamed protein product [Bursaphelenchus okinawaensis]|uniref:Endoplasmic reticulum-Golgi intermediate compartment protein 3 n=1 Tax=Bursaphelenchus okinawaensis TaxID=465554 RepID=A0A811LRI2_9BILA|nr:unnamed protein product [Bursaphelenchus okinawaensis]CAG9127398.1 unnamed protein product [Bursaphelenchus okinawaensis]